MLTFLSLLEFEGLDPAFPSRAVLDPPSLPTEKAAWCTLKEGEVWGGVKRCGEDWEDNELPNYADIKEATKAS